MRTPLELELVADLDAVRAGLGDLRLEIAADLVAVERDPVPAAALVEADRPEVLVRRDEPGTPEATARDVVFDGLQKRPPDAPALHQPLDRRSLDLSAVRAEHDVADALAAQLRDEARERGHRLGEAAAARDP